MSSETPSFRLWPVNSTFDYLPSVLVSKPPYYICHTFFTSIPDVPSNTYSHISFCLPPSTTEEPYLHNSPITCPHTSVCTQLIPMQSSLTSRLQNLSRPLGAIRQRQSDNLIVPGEFDLIVNQHTLQIPPSSSQKPSQNWGHHSHSPKSPEAH